MTIRRKMWLSIIGILVLTVLAGIIDYPKVPALKIGSFTKSFDTKLGLDLKGGTSLLYQAETSSIPETDKESAVQGVRDVIERRVNAFGVSEPVVRTYKQGADWRISVDLAGVKDINQAIQLIGETPTLEFREEAEQTPLSEDEKVAAEQQNNQIKAKAEEVLKRVLANEKSFEEFANEFSEDPGNTDATTGEKFGGNLGFVTKDTLDETFATVLFDSLKDGEITKEIIRSQFGYHIIKREETKTVEQNGQQVTQVRARHILFRTIPLDFKQTDPYTQTGLSGKQLRRSEVQFDPTTGEPNVLLQFNEEGARLFGEITKKNINKTVAIYLDGIPISVPTVNQEITNGEAVITGQFTLTEAKELSQRLNAGALPVPITLVNQQTIDASLGEQSIHRSFFAGVFGFLLVALFMVLYYRFPGFCAVFALVIYILIVFAIFKIWPVTLTLAGIAGFILSIGIAVDANILIFERTKEELRAGASLQRAIESGFERAWLSIRDSNISSIITSLILIWFGTSFIKGFAITLIIGIVVSMFSAITITRTFLRLSVSPKFENRLWLFGVKKNKEN